MGLFPVVKTFRPSAGGREKERTSTLICHILLE